MSRATATTSELLDSLHFEPGMAVERQVVRYVRGLITQGKLAPKTRIPPIRTLAKSWNTNYFTIQAALRQLVCERLLVQSPKLGTFVAPLSRKLSRVCLYHSQAMSHHGFYSQLNLQLYRLLAERGVTSVAFFDSRSEKQKRTMPPEIDALVKGREIDGLIASSFDHTSVDWMNRLTIPASLMANFEALKKFGGVSVNMPAFAELAIEAVIKAKRRRIGVISFDPDTKEIVHAEALRRGLALAQPKNALSSGDHNYEIEEFGFRACEQFLSMRTPPDCLICYPDDATRGVINSLLQRSIKVPKTLLVISHQNQEMPFFSPFPIVRINVRVEDFAEVLISQLDTQIAGEPVSPRTVIPFLAE